MDTPGASSTGALADAFDSPQYLKMHEQDDIFIDENTKARMVEVLVIPQDGNRPEIWEASAYTTTTADGDVREDVDLRHFFPGGAASILLCTIPSSGRPLPFSYRVYLDNYRTPRPLNRAIDAMLGQTWVGNIVVVRYARANSQKRQSFAHIQRPEAELVVALLGESVVVSGMTGVGKTTIIDEWVKARGTRTELVNGESNELIVTSTWPLEVLRYPKTKYTEWHTLAELDVELTYLKFVETEDAAKAVLKYRGIDGVIIVFSVDSWASFQYAKTQLSTLAALKHKPKMIAMLGSKCEIPIAARKVMPWDVKDLRKIVNITYIETTTARDHPSAGSGLHLIDYVLRGCRQSLQEVSGTQETEPFSALLCGLPTFYIAKLWALFQSYTTIFHSH
ncbi:hypothetical protein NMY22_g11188 [Coprinellus aureogranulatus]|nr:hypothetical protein NMY22_g11188 [Coprinellus aureogranulatus]